MKKTNKLLLTLLLVLLTAVLVAVGLTAAAKDPAVIASGYCGAEGDGTNVAWTLTDDWTLTISGTGAMATFEESIPWDDVMELEAVKAIGFESVEAAQQAIGTIDEMSAEGFRLGAQYLNCYRSMRERLRVVIEEGVTSVSDGTFSLPFQTELTLPASLQQIGDYGYAHDFTKLTVLGTGVVEGLEVPAYKIGAEYPQTLQEKEDSGKYGMGIYYIGVLMLDDVLPTAASRPDLSAEERLELADAIAAYYAASTGVAGNTVEEVYASWLDCINSALGSELTLDDLFVAVEQDGNTTYNISQAVNDAVIARFGYPSGIVFDMGGEQGNYMLHSVTLDKIGSEFVVAPWFTLCAPAGSATEVLALEKGIPFETVELCPVNATHLVTRKAEIAPTATTAGHTAGWYCEDCGAWVSGEEISWIVDSGFCGEPGNEENVLWTLYRDGTFVISGSGGMMGFPQWGAAVYDNAKTAIVEEGVTAIGMCAFTDLPVESILIPASVTYIEGCAFMNCEQLETLTILNREVSLGWYNLPYHDGGVHSQNNGGGPVTCFDVMLRGYLGSTTAKQGAPYWYWPFTALCPTDYTHSVVEKADTAPGCATKWYCEDCGKYLIDPSAAAGEHTLAPPVRENEIAATCTAAGSYTEVLTCTACGNEVSRTAVTGAPLNHKNAYSVAATEATTTAHGYTAGTYCPDCDKWLSGHDVIHNHLGAQTIIKAPTDTEEGLVEIVCTVCGESGVYTASKTEPKPTDDGGDSGDSSGGFWQKIQTFTKGVIKWFLQLFKWLGKK